MLIFQVWLGPRRPPVEWMRTWKEQNPEATYWCVTDQDLDGLKLENDRLLRKLIGIGRFDGASDVLRAELLWRNGGVYVDADSRALRPLEGAPFLDEPMFAMHEPTTVQEDLINGCFMGCQPENPTMRAYIEALAGVDVKARLTPTWRTVGPQLLTQTVQRVGGCTVLQPWVFFTRTLAGDVVEGPEPSYGEHYWSSTVKRFGFAGGRPWPA